MLLPEVPPCPGITKEEKLYHSIFMFPVHLGDTLLSSYLHPLLTEAAPSLSQSLAIENYLQPTSSLMESSLDLKTLA